MRSSLHPISAFAVVAVAALFALWLAGTGHSTEGRLVALSDGRHLFLDCRGDGSPTVLLEGGFAATSQAWFKVQPAIARVTRVCSYDRAGYGRSDPGPFPRDGLAVARDLDGLLRHADEAGPFVIVGHSAGALYARIFADLRPHDVIGMVLVDPSIEYQDERFSSHFGPGFGSVEPLRERAERCLEAAEDGRLPSLTPGLRACAPQRRSAADGESVANSLRPSSWRTQISELDTLWEATSDEVSRGRHNYGRMPLIVLTAANSYASAPPLGAALQSFWVALHRELAKRSDRGREEIVPRSSHLMMLDRPDAIEAAIMEVVVEAQGSVNGKGSE